MKRLSGAFALAFALSILAPQPARSLEPVNGGYGRRFEEKKALT